MGNLSSMSLTLHEQWRTTDAMQFRQVHSLGKSRYLLSGGIDCPTYPKTKLKCSMAVIDVATRAYVWNTTLLGHKPFEHSCHTCSLAIGVIPHPYKTDFCGLIALSLFDGSIDEETTAVDGVIGIAALSGDAHAYCTSADGGLWVSQAGSRHAVCRLPTADQLRALRLTRFDDTHFVITLQRIRIVGGRGAVDFVHEFRRCDGSLVWQHATENDSIATRAESDEVLTYTNAGEDTRSRVECLHAVDGAVKETFVIPTSIANLVLCEDDHFLFSSPQYELCVFDRRTRKATPASSFPKQFPGWLNIAVAESERSVLVSKVDNFLSPKTTLASFAF